MKLAFNMQYMAHNFKDLKRRTSADKFLNDKAFKWISKRISFNGQYFLTRNQKEVVLKI